jgi:sugar/nucleoside kinase (ribokinase family)
MPRRTTGAGDTWNGGNILGILLGLSPEQRLLLANAVAGSFIESREALRPTLSDTVSFIENRETDMREIALCEEA